MNLWNLYQENPTEIGYLLLFMGVLPFVVALVMNKAWGPKMSFGKSLLGVVIFLLASFFISDWLIGTFLYKVGNTLDWSFNRALMTIGFNVLVAEFFVWLLINKFFYRQDNVIFFKTTLIILFFLPLSTIAFLYIVR